MKNKIGQILTMTEDFIIESCFDKKVIQVKTGDTGFIDSKGSIHYIDGQARGKMQKLKDVEIKGYDYESIATLIFKKIYNEYGLAEVFEDYGIEKKGFIDSIEDILTDIL
ncbi:hypothetical protein LGL08_20450 [Clostridium estertheticum]|uniref:hypothetical protein n=1 Tax=Clostridium estertheticum TaxID=238834 RepID=UPI001CF3A66D|nr:hypothetical protein [Clostridium estertheticum]MCB2308847.1 hypothetical protein [Clostridium estertheticum]MCB2347259.1 hypothetical protein [Clostridium estertheticum]MCB2351900.1 hypothetical protein [Clostridium estertheticum]WAG48462.1 hypothetical protein LL127_23355 [Clostridium estertheticum]